MTSADTIRIETLTPLSVGQRLWRRDGSRFATLIVKVSFRLIDRAEAEFVATEPFAVRGSPFADSENAPYLPTAGITLVGRARALNAQAVRRLSARICIRTAENDATPTTVLDKSVMVLGDRATADATPAFFVEMPLIDERSFGGPDVPDNPVGVGSPGAAHAQPNILPRDGSRAFASFGPVHRLRPKRKWMLARVSGALLDDPKPALPDDLDWRCFHVAPIDQQVPFLSGREWIRLEGFSAQTAAIESYIPAWTPRARLRVRGRVEEMALVADFLKIDADTQVCSLFWRGHLAVAEASELAAVVGLETEGAPIAWPSGWEVGAAEGQTTLNGPRPEGLQALIDDSRPAIAAAEVDETLDAGALARMLAVARGAGPAAAGRATELPGATPAVAPKPSLLSGLAAPPAVAAEETAEAVGRTGNLGARSPRSTLHLGANAAALIAQAATPFKPSADPAPPPSIQARVAPVSSLHSELTPFAVESPEDSTLPPMTSPSSTRMTLPFRSSGAAPPSSSGIAPPSALSVPVAPPAIAPPAIAPPAIAPPVVAPPAVVAPPPALAPKAAAASAVDDTQPPPPAARRSLVDQAQFDVPPPPRVGPLTNVASAAPEPIVAPPPMMHAGPIAEAPAVVETPSFLLGSRRIGGDPSRPPAPSSSGVSTQPQAAARASSPDLGPPIPVPAPSRRGEPDERARDSRPGVEALARSPVDAKAARPLVVRPSAMRTEVLERIAKKLPLAGLDLAGVDLSGVDLSGQVLVRANLRGARLVRTNLADANLSGADLSNADLEDADLTAAKLVQINLEAANLAGARLTRATLNQASFEGARAEQTLWSECSGDRVGLRKCTLVEASFAHARIENADFTGATLESSDFGGANLQRARFDDAMLLGGSFDGARLDGSTWFGARCEDTSFRKTRLSGARLDGATFTNHKMLNAELSQASLRGATLTQVDLSKAALSQADLTGAKLIGCALREANLLGVRAANLSGDGVDLSNGVLDFADFRGATLKRLAMVGGRAAGATFENAKLEGADLRRLDVSRANARNARFVGAELARMIVAGADFSGANLSGANLFKVELDKARTDKTNLEMTKNDRPVED